jgi:hypothetical protein
MDGISADCLPDFQVFKQQVFQNSEQGQAYIKVLERKLNCQVFGIPNPQICEYRFMFEENRLLVFLAGVSLNHNGKQIYGCCLGNLKALYEHPLQRIRYNLSSYFEHGYLGMEFFANQWKPKIESISEQRMSIPFEYRLRIEDLYFSGLCEMALLEESSSKQNQQNDSGVRCDCSE